MHTGVQDVPSFTQMGSGVEKTQRGHKCWQCSQLRIRVFARMICPSQQNSVCPVTPEVPLSVRVQLVIDTGWHPVDTELWRQGLCQTSHPFLWILALNLSHCPLCTQHLLGLLAYKECTHFKGRTCFYPSFRRVHSSVFLVNFPICILLLHLWHSPMRHTPTLTLLSKHRY